MNGPETLDHRLGTISHLSPLLAKAKRYGLSEITALLALAVARGCRHYRPYVEAMGASAPKVSRTDYSDEELCIALLHGSWPYEPIMIRAAAQLMGGAYIDPRRLLKLAERERCQNVLAYIARHGLATEPANPFWQRLVAEIPLSSTAAATWKRLPHPSRFRSETGVVNPRRSDMPRVQWLRPAPRS